MSLEYRNPEDNIERGDDALHTIDLEMDGERIGRAEMTYYSRPFPHYLVSELYVEHAYHGRGYARRIMEQVEEFLRNKKKAGVLVDAIDPASPASGMYARRGWIRVPDGGDLYVYNLPRGASPDALRGYALRSTDVALRPGWAHLVPDEVQAVADSSTSAVNETRDDSLRDTEEHVATVAERFERTIDERIALWESVIDESDVDADIKKRLRTAVSRARLWNDRIYVDVYDHFRFIIGQMLAATWKQGDAARDVFVALRDDMWDLYWHTLRP